MSSVHSGSRAERSPTDRDHRNEVVGTTVALILAPVVVAAFGIALLGVIEALTGWSPELVKRLAPDDSIYIQNGFTKVRVIMIGVGVGVGFIAALLIQWALHFSAPAKRTPVEATDDVDTDRITTAVSAGAPPAEPAEVVAPAPTATPPLSRLAPQPVERPKSRSVDQPSAQSVARSTTHRSV